MTPADPLGKAVHCPQCFNFLKASRLTLEEQALTADSIRPRPEDGTQEDVALRFLAKSMLADPYGFLSIYGPVGNAKSLLLTVLVAEFARAKRQAAYFNADDLVYLINPGETKEIDGLPAEVRGNPDAILNFVKTVPVLAIDELDKIGWTPWQVQRIGAIIEHRYRNAERLVTLLAMNRPPSQWRNASEVEHISDRLTDARFNRPWPQGKPLPPCLAEYKENVDGVTIHYAPGLFRTRLGSFRPFLVRDGKVVAK